MSLTSSNAKLGQDIDPTVRRWASATTRDLEQLFLLLGQGLGGFSNESPGSVSQDVTTDGMGVEGNQGDYRFSGPASLDQLANGLANNAVSSGAFLQRVNNLSDLLNTATARSNLGLGSAAVLNSPIPIANGGTSATTGVNACYALTALCVNFGSPTKYTSTGAHTFNIQSATRFLYIICVGAGGGGGGSAAGNGPGGGGGAGAMTWAIVPVPGGSSITATVGAAGTGGASGTPGTDGTNGGNSFTSNGVTAKGGLGGKGYNGSTDGQARGGQGGYAQLIYTAAPTGFPFGGANGESGNPGIKGSGSSGLAGFGGRGWDDGSTQFGEGGSGGAVGSAGSNAVDGCILIYEA